MERIILGIDPGMTVMGYALLAGDREARVLTMGVIELQKIKDQFERLTLIFKRIDQLIAEYRPLAVAVEAPFYGKNVQSMLKLGRAQGVAIAAALKNGLPVVEYLPRRVKQAVTGNGAASKEQVAAFLKLYLNFEVNTHYLDATDALAVALCHFLQRDSPVLKKSSGSWKDFLQKNPDRMA